MLEQIQGTTLELDLEIDPREARWVQLNVLRSPDAQEQTSITFYNYDRTLCVWYHTPGIICLDGSRSSESGDVWLRPPREQYFGARHEPLALRVFVDRSVVEVLRTRGSIWRCACTRAHRQRGSFPAAQGQDAVLKRLNAWEMRAIWP